MLAYMNNGKMNEVRKLILLTTEFTYRDKSYTIIILYHPAPLKKEDKES